MNISPLQLTDYFVHSMNMEALADYDASKPADLDLDALSVNHHVFQPDEDKPRSLGIDLTIKQSVVEGKNLPYSYELHMLGFIQVLPENLSPEKMKRLVEINGPSMLFGAAREIVRAATGRGPYGPVLMPSTTFYKPSNEAKAKKKTARKAAKQAVKKKNPA